MKRIGTVAALAAVATFAGASAVRAQLPGIPYGPVETGMGISVSADYAMPGDSLGGGSAYGLTGGLGLGRIGLSASLGASKPDNYGSAEVTYAGRIGLKVFGGGLNPVTVGAQVGASSVSYTFPVVGSQRSTAILPAAWVRFSPPLFPLKPWGQVYYVAGDNVEKEVRLTAGANFNFLLGLGVHAAYDWGNSGATWGVGAHFNFHVPTM